MSFVGSWSNTSQNYSSQINDMSDTDGALYFAQGGIGALFAMAIFPLGVIAAVRARRHGDPARVAFSWLKALFTFAFLGYVFVAVSGIVRGAEDFVLLDSTFLDERFYVQRINNIISTVMRLFMRFAEIAMMITCAELGNGFMYGLMGQRTSSQRTIRILILVGGLVLAIFSLVDAGLRGSLLERYYKSVGNPSSSDYDNVPSLFRQIGYMDRVMIAFYVLSAVFNVLLMAQASIVKHEFRNVHSVSNTVSLYLVATILSVPRQIWDLVYAGARLWDTTAAFDKTLIVMPIDITLNLTFFFIGIVLLFVIGIRRGNGLWTEVQPWMDGGGPVVAPRKDGNGAWNGQGGAKVVTEHGHFGQNEWQTQALHGSSHQRGFPEYIRA